MHAIAADLTLLVHAGFIGFVIGGQCLVLVGWLRGWRATRGLWFRLTHLGAMLFVAAQAWQGRPCPLTVLENRWRLLAGENTYPESFVGAWLARLIYYEAPSWVFTTAYTAFALLVLASFIAYPPRWRR